MNTFLPNVLVIDDDPGILFLHKIIIKGEGLHPNPITFFDPEEALNHILENDIPEKGILIFLDINMPRMSGWELLNHLEKELRHVKVRVVMVTSSLDRSDKEKAQKSPFVMDFWEKPLNENQIALVAKQIPIWFEM
ncbi:Response regulator receiver domain-containing protein [Algoriphagus ornithinivorans]|uniref:Response regulator receiver domain-containing protein n=1 Tax=Algoriphagus ornithinivorans TaxID=226506 RepID=A0A1I5J516_9BACT|nr:response regulator [Algoriphagus ornithinivorans]SFO67739.1 Response regulator receiver domain-containing protein [Algoriphagus ornithinivorans]